MIKNTLFAPTELERELVGPEGKRKKVELLQRIAEIGARLDREIAGGLGRNDFRRWRDAQEALRAAEVVVSAQIPLQF